MTFFMLAACIWIAAGVAAFWIPRRLGDVRGPLLGLTCLLAGIYTAWSAPPEPAEDGGLALLISVVGLVSVLGFNRILTRRIRFRDVHLADNELAAAVLDTAGALVIVLDVDGGIVRFNRACEALTGYTAGEVAGRRFWEFLLAEEERDAVRAEFESLKAGRFPSRFENDWVLKDGRRRRIAWSNTAMLDASGRVQLIIGTGIDVTERYEAEAALRKSEERFSRAFHGSPLSLVIATLDDGILLDVNQAFLDLFGYDRQEVLGRPTKAMGMWENPGDRDVLMEQLAAHGVVRDCSARFRDRRGRLRTARVWMEMIELQGQQCVLGITEDVTERLRSENALKESEHKYRSLFDTSRDGIVYCTLEGRVTDANPAYVDMTGFPLEELRRLRYQDMTPSKWHEMEAAIIRDQVMTRGYSEDYEKEYVRKDGRVIPISIRAWIIRDDQGRPDSMWARVIDISEQRRHEVERVSLESQLRHSQKMEALGTLTAGVSHDFNNLLMAINGYVDVAESCAERGDEELSTALNGIREAAQHATHITKSMLTFSRKAAFTRTPLSLSRLVENATGLLKHLMGSKIALEAHVDADDDIWIEADASQIQQVLMNLVINARDAMPAGGRLQIALRRVGRRSPDLSYDVPLFRSGTALLTVSDNGCGMTEEVRTRVFEPFFTTKPRGQGTGLGLSVVHGIVAEHRGYVEIRSTHGAGTTAVVALPCVDAGEREAQSADNRPGRGERVLVIEPEPSIRAVVTSGLRHAGYRVVGVANFDDARAQIERQTDPWHAILAALDDQGDTAIRFVTEMRRRGIGAAVIIMADTEAAPLDTLRSHDADLLTKPFRLTDMVSTVARSIRMRTAEPHPAP